MHPAIFVTAAPFADLRPGAARQFEGALVAWRLDDDVIRRPSERVIENEDTFLGCGRYQDILGIDSPIHLRNDFPQRRRPRRFRVSTPMLEEAFVGTGLEVEQFLDGSGLRVGAR